MATSELTYSKLSAPLILSSLEKCTQTSDDFEFHGDHHRLASSKENENSKKLFVLQTETFNINCLCLPKNTISMRTDAHSLD